MIAIIGGGIIGLAIGWQLARAGRDVTVIERGRHGSGATWAAAGMLAPHAEATPQEDVLQRFLQQGRARWPSFASELEAASGVDLDYRTEGALLVALDRDDAEQLRFRYELQRDLDLPVEWVSGYRARTIEPHLSRDVTAAVLSEHDHQVDNRRVVVALREAFRASGGRLWEGVTVTEVDISGGTVAGVRLEPTTREAVAAGTNVLAPSTGAGHPAPGTSDVESAQHLSVDAVIVAAGAWSREIAGIPDRWRPPIRPVKGQMVALQMDRGAPLVGRMIWAPDCYLVPRTDGRLLVGATVEDRGFDTEVTAGGLFELLRGAWEAVPAVDDLPVIEAWAGLRPTSRDDAPLLGETEVRGLVMATGHHRNGILLAPITADAIAELVDTGELPEIARPFHPRRFVE